ARAPSRSMPPLDSAEDLGERLEARHVVAWQEAVDVGECRAHAAGERLVLRVTLERVDPDDGVCLARETRHLAADEEVVAPFAAVREDDDHGAPGERAAAPLVVVGLQRLADPRPAGPVDDALRRLRESRLR